MRILGIDPGYAIVGWGILDFENNRFAIVDFGAITTDKDMPFGKRLRAIYEDLDYLIKCTHPEALSIEKLFFQTNAKTAIDVAQARGVILLCAEKNGLPVYEYTPLQVKQSVTGYGKADKHQIMEMTKKILGLKSVPKPDDTADALAMAICHGHVGGSGLSEAPGRLRLTERKGI